MLEQRYGLERWSCPHLAACGRCSSWCPVGREKRDRAKYDPGYVDTSDRWLATPYELCGRGWLAAAFAVQGSGGAAYALEFRGMALAIRPDRSLDRTEHRGS
jgi:hypothetical protein